MTRRLAVLAVVALSAGAACGKKGTCENAADKLLELAKAEGKGGSDDPAKGRAQFIEACQKHQPSQAQLDCMVAAKTGKDFMACNSNSDTMRKSKATEPVVNLKKLSLGARAYFEEEHNVRGGAPPPKHFPTGTAGPTPPLGSCCKEPGGKCAPDVKLWSDPLWQALNFSMDDPHRYSYVYMGAGMGTSATFSVTAYGDLDCDGEYSTFEMVGSVQADGTVTGSGAMFRDKELE